MHSERVSVGFRLSVALCDDKGYVIHINIYAEKDIARCMHGEEGDAVTVVKNLLKDARALNKGYLLKMSTQNLTLQTIYSHKKNLPK